MSLLLSDILAGLALGTVLNREDRHHEKEHTKD